MCTSSSEYLLCFVCSPSFAADLSFQSIELWSLSSFLCQRWAKVPAVGGNLGLSVTIVAAAVGRRLVISDRSAVNALDCREVGWWDDSYLIRLKVCVRNKRKPTRHICALRPAPRFCCEPSLNVHWPLLKALLVGVIPTMICKGRH